MDPAISDTLAWIEYKKGLFDSAANSLKDITQQVPQSGLYQFHYGMTLWKMERAFDAKHALNRALELKIGSPEADEARRALARLDQGTMPPASASQLRSGAQKN